MTLAADTPRNWVRRSRLRQQPAGTFLIPVHGVMSRKRIFDTRRRFSAAAPHRWLMRVGMRCSPSPSPGCWAGAVRRKFPTRPSNDRTEADAIVVLTGGSDRLKEGLLLLAQGGKQLLISGVHANTDIPALLQTGTCGSAAVGGGDRLLHHRRL
jgi:hypothetical protein